LNETGKPEENIWQELDRRLAKDMTYESGRILGSMCTRPHDIALEVFTHFLEKNLGDPGLFPGTAEIEKEVLKELAELFHCPTADGSLVTGGSEANLIGMRIAKKLKNKVLNPEFIVPASGHASFDKAADLLDIKLVKIPLEEDFSLAPEKVAEQVTPNTIGIVGVAGSTALGLVDPIEELGHIARENNLYFHVDAAFGGFVLPFLSDLGYEIPKWDFEVPEVNSLTADPHKMGMNVIPSGGFLFRDCSLLEELGFNIPYLAGGCFKHLQITGTRPGGVAIAFWALIKSLGREGFRNIVKNAMDLTHYLASEIEIIPRIKLATQPTMNIVGIIPEGDSLSAPDLDARLREKGWALGCFRRENLVRVVLMPHVTQEHIDEFLADLKTCL